MTASRFTVGEHVQARTSMSVPEGTPGSVHEVVRTVQDLYYVQFDGYDHPHLMHVADLKRVDDGPDQQRTAAAG
jgi:hypothetical protein